MKSLNLSRIYIISLISITCLFSGSSLATSESDVVTPFSLCKITGTCKEHGKKQG
jgi:hypothetical protein